MKTLFHPGDRKIFRKIVTEADTAVFEAGEVHPVYATFALARDAEWVGRLFVLEMKEDDEEGIGTFVSVKHLAPAKVGEEVLFESEIINMEGNTISCNYRASVGERVIAEGVQVQKILKKKKLEELLR